MVSPFAMADLTVPGLKGNRPVPACATIGVAVTSHANAISPDINFIM